MSSGYVCVVSPQLDHPLTRLVIRCKAKRRLGSGDRRGPYSRCVPQKTSRFRGSCTAQAN